MCTCRQSQLPFSHSKSTVWANRFGLAVMPARIQASEHDRSSPSLYVPVHHSSWVRAASGNRKPRKLSIWSNVRTTMSRTDSSGSCGASHAREARHRLFPARHRFGASLQVRPLSQCPARLIPIARAISTSATHSSRTFRHPYCAWDATEQISLSEQSGGRRCQEFHALRSTRSEQRRRLGKRAGRSSSCRAPADGAGADQVLQRGHLQSGSRLHRRGRHADEECDDYYASQIGGSRANSAS